ncbi:MAG: hypothetical protein ACI86H_002586 [bacterium]|jgi:hypothetical protein
MNIVYGSLKRKNNLSMRLFYSVAHNTSKGRVVKVFEKMSNFYFLSKRKSVFFLKFDDI